MNLTAIAAVAISLAAPCLPSREVDRYARDFAAVAATREELIMLTVTAGVESSFDRRVETCEKTGDNGAAVTLFQLHGHHLVRYTREQVCASNRVATRVAHSVLLYLRRVTGDPRAALIRYLGAPPKNDVRATRRLELWDRLEREVPQE